MACVCMVDMCMPAGLPGVCVDDMDSTCGHVWGKERLPITLNNGRSTRR